jgi:transposase
MKKRTLTLDPWERITLEEMRDHQPKAYLRERAAALLKIADGMSVFQVARCGLLRARKADTVYTWLNAYQQDGVTGLSQQPRRRRHFSPRAGE